MFERLKWAATLAATALITVSVPAVGQVTLNIVDVAGNLALTQDAIDRYVKNNPQKIGKVTYTKAPSPELPGKLKAMQGAGRSDIDLVLTGTDFLAAGIEQGVLVKILPDNAGKFPNLVANYQPAAAKMQELAQDYGIAVAFMPAGPLLEYNPDKVKQVPTTPAELLAWCKANPNKLIYARPANSGPGRTFIMGLPYILGDKNPKDPVNGWEKTWAYLKELNSCIEYYPTGTGAVMKELGEGSRDMTVTMTGWDINPRVLGIVPKNYKVTPLKGMTWINDAHYMVVPKGRAGGQDGGRARPDGVHADAGSAGVHVRQGLFLPGPRGEERSAVDGAEGEPGRDQGIRPPRVRGLARAVPAHAVTGTEGAGRGVPDLGPAGRRAENQVTQTTGRGPRAARAAAGRRAGGLAMAVRNSFTR
jgi:putative spermidine/putrescine transport system substrate-binding protein